MATEIKWPDLSKDQKAWELARTALGVTDADMNDPKKREELIQKAEEIKRAL